MFSYLQFLEKSIRIVLAFFKLQLSTSTPYKRVKLSKNLKQIVFTVLFVFCTIGFVVAKIFFYIIGGKFLKLICMHFHPENFCTLEYLYFLSGRY